MIGSKTLAPIIGSLALVALANAADDKVPTSAADAKPLTVGAHVPEVTLRTVQDKSVKLAKVLGGKPTIIIFYRGSWCPFCNRNLADIQTVESDLTKLGYQIIAISPDVPEHLTKMAEDHKLTYTLYSDSGASAMKKFGVAFRVDDATFDKYRTNFNIDLEEASGQPHHILPVPSVFIIDKTGKIVYVHSNPDYKVRLKGMELLDAAKAALN